MLDATLDNVKADSAVGAGANRDSFNRVNSNSSYVGFKGTEDLGDGLKAIFQFETGFNTDTGIYSASGRDTFVGLNGDFGTIKFGNLTGPTRAIGTSFELLPGRTGIGTFDSILGRGIAGTAFNAGKQATAFGGTATLFDNRINNTLSYTTPDFNGFNATFNYDPSENRTNSTAATAVQANGKVWELGLNYDNGGWSLKYAYAKNDYGTDATAAAGTLTEWKSNRIGVGYTFEGGHKINFIWDRQDQDLSGGNDLQTQGYALEGLYKISAPGSLIASYVVAKDASGSFLASNSDTGAKLYTVGYLHALSKRTTLKALYSRINNDNKVAYDFGTNGVSGGTATTSFGNGADVSGLSLGIRHNF